MDIIGTLIQDLQRDQLDGALSEQKNEQKPSINCGAQRPQGPFSTENCYQRNVKPSLN